MKRFLTALLVAMLVVTSLATVAFASGTATASAGTKTVEAGTEVEVAIPVTVSGEFANYELYVSSALPITAISGITANVATGKVAFATDENITSHTFTVTVKVAADTAPGTYPVSLSVLFVSDRNLVVQEVAVNNGAVIVVEPECEHSWNDEITTPATCVTDGVRTYTCILCGETYEEVIPATGHDWVCGNTWEYDSNNEDAGHWHYHTCSVCGEVNNTAHTEEHACYMVAMKESTDTEDGWYKYACKCGYSYYVIIPAGMDPVPPTGDITSQIALGTAAILVTMMGAVALVVKRKTTV